MKGFVLEWSRGGEFGEKETSKGDEKERKSRNK